jgi:ABC-type nitrate/sulfonate/bicarbonate transport system permease component
MTKGTPARLLVGAAATLGIVALVWVYTASNQSYVVSPVPDVLEAFRDAWLFDRVGTDVVPSLTRMFAGYALATAAGVGLGLLMGSSVVVSAMATPVVSFLRSIPAAALLPPFIVIFGIGDTTKVVVIGLVCSFPILLNTADGVRDLDDTMLATARVYGLTGPQRLLRVVLPAVLPRIFAGMRTSLSIAILLLVTSEMIASTNGIGYFVFQAQQQYSVTDMWAGVLLLGLLGFAFNHLFGVVERRALRWDRQETGTR